MLNKAKYLAAAGAFEYALQFALPVLLTRTLVESDFASYRFLWLVYGTVAGIVLLGLPQSLFYFLPRRDSAGRATLLLQTIALCGLLGAAASLVIVVAAAAPWSAGAFALLPHDRLAFVLFLSVLCATAVYDTVASAMKDIETQARINIAASLTRVVAVLVGVWIGTIEAIVWALVVFAFVRFALQALFVSRRVPLRKARVTRASVREQVGYALPFGLATGCWQLRGQAEQWIGAAMLAARDYASLSVAASMLPVVMLVRNAITQSTAAELNRLESEGKRIEMLAINGAGNAMAAALLFPLLAVLFAVAAPLVAVVYTPTYANAALVLQLLIVGAIGSSFIETSSMAKAMNLGRQLLRFDAAMLVVAVALSVAGGMLFGLPGIVAGSVLGRYLSTVFCAALVARELRVPLARFQPWALLAKTLAASALAALLGLVVVHHVTVEETALLRLAGGAASVAAGYLMLAFAIGLPLSPHARSRAAATAGRATARPAAPSEPRLPARDGATTIPRPF